MAAIWTGLGGDGDFVVVGFRGCQLNAKENGFAPTIRPPEQSLCKMLADPSCSDSIREDHYKLPREIDGG